MKMREIPVDGPTARAADSESTGAVPEGFALVPLTLTREMTDVISDEGWQWEDLLAAAEAITPEQYDQIAAAPGVTCAHDYVRSDRVCTECGESVAPAPDSQAERGAFRDTLRAALKSYRRANPSRYLNEDQVDASDSEFVSDLMTYVPVGEKARAASSQSTATHQAHLEQALTQDEIAEFDSTTTDFEDCGETATDYEKLIEWARRGLLECTNFRVTKAGEAVRAAAQAANGDTK